MQESRPALRRWGVRAAVLAGLAAAGLALRFTVFAPEPVPVQVAAADVGRVEPTGNLDTASGRQVLELLEGLHATGLTLVVVTHDPNVGRRGQRILQMVDGRIARRLEPADLERVS